VRVEEAEGKRAGDQETGYEGCLSTGNTGQLIYIKERAVYQEEAEDSLSRSLHLYPFCQEAIFSTPYSIFSHPPPHPLPCLGYQKRSVTTV